MGVVGEKRNDRARISGDNALTGTVIVENAVDGTKEEDGGPVRLRLFVGGLGPTVSKSDVQQRFAPLGNVHQIQIVGSKSGEEGHRRFAYVEFEASSEASLRKLFSAVCTTLFLYVALISLTLSCLYIWRFSNRMMGLQEFLSLSQIVVLLIFVPDF